jgi:hypothetical protein
MNKFVDTVGLYLLYGAVWVYSYVESACRRRTPRFTSVWEAVRLSDADTTTASDYDSLNKTDSDVVLHYITKDHGIHSAYKTVVHWVYRRYFIDDIFDNSPSAPWFFIGYRDGEDTIDCTDSLDHLVVSGNKVTISLLYYLEPQSAGKTWVYINPKTFNQVEFPSEGILIGDVPAPAKND